MIAFCSKENPRTRDEREHTQSPQHSKTTKSHTWANVRLTLRRPFSIISLPYLSNIFLSERMATRTTFSLAPLLATSMSFGMMRAARMAGWAGSWKLSSHTAKTASYTSCTARVKG